MQSFRSLRNSSRPAGETLELYQCKDTLYVPWDTGDYRVYPYNPFQNSNDIGPVVDPAYVFEQG
jgi:hypothetical protein